MAQAKAVPTFHRCRVALCAVGLCVDRSAREIGVSAGHLKRVLQGERIPSQRLLQRLQEVLGPAAWAYALGESDVLPCPEKPAPVPTEQRAAA